MPLYTDTHHLLGRRPLRRHLHATAPVAARVVAEHFGRRPLASVQITLTTPNGLVDLYLSTQTRAAGIRTDQAPTLDRLLEWNHTKITSVTGLAPAKGAGTLTLLNARRLRRPDDLTAGLLYELVRVDQLLLRKGGTERWIAHLCDLAGTHPLTKQARRALDQALAAEDREAERLIPALLHAMQPHKKRLTHAA